MNKNRLGKGLSVLLGEKKISLSDNIFNNDFSSEKVENIDINLLSPSKFQPRKYFDEEQLKELSLSIQKYGILQPLIVRKTSDDKYEIIAGERRYRASILSGLNTVPVIIKDFNDQDALSLALIENIQRSDLSPIEEAEAYNVLIQNFNYSSEDVANFVGKSRPYISNMVRLLLLPNEVKQLLIEKKLDIGHARALINVENCVELANKVVNDNLTVRDIENIVKNVKKKQTIVNTNNSISDNLDYDLNYINNIEKKIFDKLNLKSKIKFNGKTKKGKLIIAYNSINELENLINLL